MVAAIVIYNFWNVILRIAFTEMSEEVIKGKGHSKELTFLSSLIASKSSAFQPLKCSQTWRNSSRKKRLRRPPFWNCLGSQAVFMWRHSVRLEIGGKEKNLQPTSQGILHKASKIYFFLAGIHFTIFNAVISEFEACLAQIIWLKRSHNSEW